MRKRSALLLLVLVSFAFILQSPLKLGPVPAELPKPDSTKTKLTWPSIIEPHYNTFAYDYKNESDSSYIATQLPCSIFGGIYDWWEIRDKAGNYSGFGNRSIYNALVKPFYRSPQMRMALYKWIRPSYITAFKSFPQWKKNIYIRMLAHAKTYLAGFNYAAELKILNAKKDFETNGIHGPRGEFHRMETWIFRRVHNQEMTVHEMQQWVAIFEKDLREANSNK